MKTELRTASFDKNTKETGYTGTFKKKAKYNKEDDMEGEFNISFDIMQELGIKRCD